MFAVLAFFLFVFIEFCWLCGWFLVVLLLGGRWTVVLYALAHQPSCSLYVDEQFDQRVFARRDANIPACVRIMVDLVICDLIHHLLSQTLVETILTTHRPPVT